jgi:rubrerythrin
MSDPQAERAELVAELNDLLQLDHDAVQAYTIAIDSVENRSYGETLRQFRADHERHITELSNLIRARGGQPARGGHVTTGIFKLALQQLGRAGGDRGIVLAFETNERQVRDKYWRQAERPHEPPVAAVLRRAAADEERHYSWATETLKRMGAGAEDSLEEMRHLMQQVQERAADALEGVERKVAEQMAPLQGRQRDDET